MLTRATNDTLRGIKTKASQVIRGKVTLKAAVVKAAFRVERMTVKDLNAVISCAGSPLPLIHFSATKTKKGVSVKVLKSGKKKTIPHAFIATMDTGHKGVFWRKENIRGKRWKVGVYKTLPTAGRWDPAAVESGLSEYQLPIEELYGPRVPDVFDDPEIMAPVFAEANVRLQARLEHHTNRLIESAR
ncbi:MAG: hypothetical protein GY868_05350 [Deltaproteobacteria bacterium]|nr:hypothetical protein [Deltaproteobacteria bacterium]